jgi:hypothetical protein
VDTLVVFKAHCGDSGGSDSLVYCFWVRYVYLGGDDEDGGLDSALDARCEVILAKVWDHIVFSFFYVESFVIGFAIVKIPSVVI